MVIAKDTPAGVAGEVHAEQDCMCAVLHSFARMVCFDFGREGLLRAGSLPLLGAEAHGRCKGYS